MNNKLFDAAIGFIVGDAFGVPYEFIPRENIEVNEKMIGYGSHNQPAGTWSDDSSMLLATIDAIRFPYFDARLIALNFLHWLYNGKYTKHGKVFDIGGRTYHALVWYSKQHTFLNGDEYSNGNGSLMRILPLAFIDNVTDKFIDEVSEITHPHEISKACCRIYVKFIRAMLDGCSDEDLREKIVELNDDENGILDINAIFHIDSTGIKSTGYVVDTLEAAIWSFLHTDCYKDAVIAAVSLGNDTDTIGAITGALAAVKYGMGNIPYAWYDQTITEDVIYLIDNAIKSRSIQDESIDLELR